jgi:hypothetical protein
VALERLDHFDAGAVFIPCAVAEIDRDIEASARDLS